MLLTFNITQYSFKKKNTTNTIAHIGMEKNNTINELTTIDPIVDIGGYDTLHVRYDKSPDTK